MSWTAFEHDKAFVSAALRRGELDYAEVVGQVEETAFFRALLGEGVMERLAASYPTPRKKQEVPLWLYLASELTLRLHGAMGYGAYPYILHCGGLTHALGHEQYEHKHDTRTGRWRPRFRGYNGKNAYPRQTPCDKDFLRKMAKDSHAEALEHWFGTAVQREYKLLKGFDPEGIFSIDGTYLFVPPDNDGYEGSSQLRFDPDGRHPIDRATYENLPQERQQRCQWRRCYRAVTLSHTNAAGDYSLRCGTHVMAGRAAETPQVWPLCRRFVEALGQGVMKLLLFDRGLIDGATVSRLKGIGVDSLFPLKKGMDLWEDARALAECQGGDWEHYEIPGPPAPPEPPTRPESIQRREAARQGTLKRRRLEQEKTNGPAPPRHKLTSIDYKWIEPSRVWESCDVPVSVLLIRNHYADGKTLDWALASTRLFDDPLAMWKHYKLRPHVEEDHRQEKCFWDMTGFRSTAFSQVVSRVIFVELAYSLIQLFLRRCDHQEIVGKTRQRLLDMLLPTQSSIAVYYRQRFGHFSTYEYSELLLTLKEGARRRLLGIMRRLRRSQLKPPELPWRPEL